MTLSQGKAIFIWGTVISAVLFLGLTWDTHRQVVEAVEIEIGGDERRAEPIVRRGREST